MSESPFQITAVLHSLPPVTTRFNPPGQSALSYRAGDYPIFVTRMLQNLRTQAVFDLDNASAAPLANFNILAGNDWTIALLRAWAMVADVLAFYQERLVNEGYLRTAVEPRSVLELIRMVGYELAPPIAATTHLAFAVVDDSPAGQPQPLLIPAGTAVQSVPPAFSSHDAVKALVAGRAAPVSGLPVTFETTAELQARPAWNTLPPARFLGQHWPPAAQPRTLRLAALQTGLKPGDALLIVGSDPAAWEMALVEDVEVQAAAGVTAVSLHPSVGHVPAEGISSPAFYALRCHSALFPYSAGTVFRDSDSGWYPANIGLPNKSVCATAANWRGRIYVASGQTLYHSRDWGDNWQPLGGLPPKEILALATSPGGALAAGTDDGSVYLSPDGGNGWTPLSGPGEVEPPKGWRRFVDPVRQKLPKTVIRALLHTGDERAALLAGSDDGVFGYDAQLDSWRSLNGRFPAVNRDKGTAKLTVNALTAVADGKRFLAGTTRGVFPVEPLFNAPSGAILTAFLAFVLLLPAGLALLFPNAAPEAMAQFQPYFARLTGVLIFLTLLVFLNWLQPTRLKWVAAGLALLLYGTQPWWQLSAQTTAVIQQLLAQLGAKADLQAAGPQAINPVSVLLVAFIAANFLFAALVQVPGLVHKTFPQSHPQAEEPQILALLAHGRLVYAGTNQGLFTLEALPGWRPRLRRWLRRLALGEEPEPLTAVPFWLPIDQSAAEPARVVTALALDADGRLVAGTQTGAVYVRHAEEWRREPHVGLSRVSALVNAAGTLLAAGTAVDAAAEARWALAHLRAGQVDLDLRQPTGNPGPYAVVVDAESAALLTITGTEVQTSQDAQNRVPLVRLRVAETAVLPNFDRAAARLYCQPERLPLADDQFRPQPVDGAEIWLDGRFTGLAGRVLAVAGTAVRGGHASELATVQRAEPGDTQTRLVLDAPLRHAYVRESVTIYGNVVAASHGETVRDEVLGESDGSIANQRFSLRRPLAYLPGPTGDYVSSLSVQVSGIPWQKTATLLDQPADGRVYMVRRDENGRTLIIFGDGRQGARLPTSRERLTADYRAGGGPAGNLPPGSLTLLPARAPRLKSVNNPLPAQGGQPAEPTGEARRRAPQRLRALGRIVALRDFADFAAGFPGVGKTAVNLLPGGKRLQLAVAPRDGRPLRADDPLLGQLAEAITAVRVAQTPRVTIRPFEPVPVTLGLALFVETHLLADEEAQRKLREAVIGRLLQEFGFAARELGQPLTETELFKVVQGERGVTAVSITHLQAGQQATADGKWLTENEVRWYQLLQLSPAIDLEIRQ
ncbi:MAG: hypothetical protein KC441_14385 [Anaerolineales bacterium]|nr:hypothetical protein [Anaerolineales bacterium]